jgi:hypothetical protein
MNKKLARSGGCGEVSCLAVGRLSCRLNPSQGQPYVLPVVLPVPTQ